MDYRNRKYYLVKLPSDTHNEYIKELKFIKSVKIHNPYDYNNSHWVSEGNCMVGFSNDVENSVRTILNTNKKSIYGKPKYTEIAKNKLGH